MAGTTTGTSVQVHTYASPGLGSVNTHWAESATGVVVIDGQRLSSQAQIVIDEIKKTGKPVEAIVMTHTHPDHIGGTSAFAKAYPTAKVYASQQAQDSMRVDEGGLLALAKQWLGADFEVAAPTATLTDEGLRVAGMTFDVRQAGPGESSSMNVLYLREAQALFAADVVCNGMTPFLAEQRTTAWLKQLDWLTKEFPEAQQVYPGHGAPADLPSLVDRTRKYITTVRDLVAASQKQSPVQTPEARSGIMAAIDRAYPGYVPVAAIPDAVGMNVDGVWAELAREQGLDTRTAARKFYERHLSFFYNKDVEGLLKSDYTEDAQLLSYDFAVKGHAAMRPIFTAYLEMLGDFTVQSTEHFTETPDSVMLEATLVGKKFGERKVYDVFVFRNGKAAYHFTGTR